MTFPSAGARNSLGQGQFSKIVNACPILFKFGTQVYWSYMNVHVQYRNNQSETVDVTPVSKATIWPIIKDRAFFVNNINIHTVIALKILQWLSLFLYICFIQLNAWYITNFEKIEPMSMSHKLQTRFSQIMAIPSAGGRKIFRSRSIFHNCQLLSYFAQMLHTDVWSTSEWLCPISKQSEWNYGCDAYFHSNNCTMGIPIRKV